jgi:uridine kinase
MTAAIDWALLVHTLNNLKDPKAGPVDIPVYDFVTHSRYDRHNRDTAQPSTAFLRG